MGGRTRGGDAVRSEENGLIAVLAFGGVVVSLSQTLVIPLLGMLPAILGTSATNAAWVVTVTLLAGSAPSSFRPRKATAQAVAPSQS